MNVSRSDAIIRLTKAEGEAPSPAAPAGTPLKREEIERRFCGALDARGWTMQQFTGKTFGGQHDAEALEYVRFICFFSNTVLEFNKRLRKEEVSDGTAIT